VCVGPDDRSGVVDVFLPIFFFLSCILFAYSFFLFFFLVKRLVWSSKIIVLAPHFGVDI
jgi:hypothetical protein